jgi:hypothetical protein
VDEEAMTSLPTLPNHLTALAHTAGNGEVFWPLTTARTAAEAMASSGLAVFGGEVYIARGRAWGNLELEWTTDPGWLWDEAWSDYVERGLAHALTALESAATELVRFGLVPEAEREPMCFFACFTAAQYPAELRRSNR